MAPPHHRYVSYNCTVLRVESSYVTISRNLSHGSVGTLWLRERRQRERERESERRMFLSHLLLCLPALVLAAASTSMSVAFTTSSWSGESHPEIRDLLLERRQALIKSSGAIATVTGISLLPPIASPASAATSSKIPEWTLEGGVKFPQLALNTVGLSAEDTARALTFAVAAGVTHVDFHPGQERDGVAQYLKENPGARIKIFLNTKIRKAPPGTTPSEAAERTRAQIEEDFASLGVDSVDMLMLRDSPDCAVIQAQWAVLEEALAQKKCRSLGVINFCASALDCVLATAKVKPALNYYMCTWEWGWILVACDHSASRVGFAHSPTGRRESQDQTTSFCPPPS